MTREIDGEKYNIVLSTGSFLTESGTTVFAGFARLFDRTEAAQTIQALGFGEPWRIETLRYEPENVCALEGFEGAERTESMLAFCATDSSEVMMRFAASWQDSAMRN